jgi:hypothetical protein
LLTYRAAVASCSFDIDAPRCVLDLAQPVAAAVAEAAAWVRSLVGATVPEPAANDA